MSPYLEPSSTMRGSSFPSPLSTNTTLRVPVGMTALTGTVSASPMSISKSAFTYMPGRNLKSGFGISMRTLAVRFASSRNGLVTHAQQLHELSLACDQVGAIDRQKRRIFIDQLARTSDIQLLNVAIDTRYELPVACFIGHNQADCANGVAEWLTLHLCIAHANLLLTFDWDDKFARLFGALRLARFHAWHAGHPLHLAARRL